MYDDNQSPYRCPICLTRPSLCTEEPSTGMKTVGCLTCNCDAPIFTQRQGESKYMPLIEWDKWVVKYRNEHKNWHKDYLCKNASEINLTASFMTQIISTVLTRFMRKNYDKRREEKNKIQNEAERKKILQKK